MRPVRFATSAIGAVAVLRLAGPGVATAQVEAHVFLGSAASIPLPVTVTQAGHPDLHWTAHWATRPTQSAWYYAWRIGLWKGNRGWRLDLTHHKLYLTDPPAPIQRLEITHGFNLVTVSRAFRRQKLTYSLGAGPVLTYPTSTVRGQPYDRRGGWLGYHLSGATVVGTATREVPLVAGLSFNLDARASASYVRVPIAQGHASVPNGALHLHAGLGYRFGKDG
jgi:hypothetical protein